MQVGAYRRIAVRKRRMVVDRPLVTSRCLFEKFCDEGMKSEDLAIETGMVRFFKGN